MGESIFRSDPASVLEKQKWEDFWHKLIEKLRVKYKVKDLRDLDYVKYDLKVVRDAFGIDGILEKRILDIGCGSMSADTTGILNIRYRPFEPWLFRALKECGANPVGVDIGSLSGEEFEHYQLDLSQIGVLNRFPDQSFDGINMRAFLDSPFLAKRNSDGEIDKIRSEMSSQIKRLLKPNGKLLNIQNVGRQDIRAELGL